MSHEWTRIQGLGGVKAGCSLFAAIRRRNESVNPMGAQAARLNRANGSTGLFAGAISLPLKYRKVVQI
ncbi:MAG: hypothetical protein KF886_15850 [Candidatus Hydrogenedentes bacterium]|nr:hypothetical protein [Candidatus Hydrogenedentota bacterium]